MKRISLIEDLTAVLNFIKTDPQKAYEILRRIISELMFEKVE